MASLMAFRTGDRVSKDLREREKIKVRMNIFFSIASRKNEKQRNKKNGLPCRFLQLSLLFPRWKGLALDSRSALEYEFCTRMTMTFA